MVEFNLSYVLVSLYSMLCVLAGFQLTRILYYRYFCSIDFFWFQRLKLTTWHRHNRSSFQFGFLIAVFVWTTLRVIYFLVFYPPLVDDVNCWLYDLVFMGPVIVQFVTFCLLIIFYAYWCVVPKTLILFTIICDLFSFFAGFIGRSGRASLNSVSFSLQS